MTTDIIPKLDALRAEKLIELAHQRFSESLSDAEERVLRDCASSASPTVGDVSCDLPLVRATLLRWVVSDEKTREFIDFRGIRIWNAKIEDEVSLSNCRVDLPLDFRGCELVGPLSLVAAETHQVTLVGCVLRQGLKADRVVTRGAFLMRYIQAFDELRFQGARIEGPFECAGSELSAPGNALNLDQATVQGNVLLKAIKDGAGLQPFHSSGCLHMNGASILGDVVFSGASLELDVENPEESSLCLDRTTIGGSLELTPGFRANRKVRAVDASIQGSLACRGARLDGSGSGLNFNRVKVGGSAFLDSGFEVPGDTNLSNAQVANDLNFNGALVGRIICEGARIGGDLVWTNVQDAPHQARYLNLSGAKVQDVIDDEGSWPARGNLLLNGLTYRDIDMHASQVEGHSSDVSLPPSIAFDLKQRIAWLQRQDRENQLRPQPWLQLAKHQREMGHEGNAKRVIFVFKGVKAACSPFPLRVARTMFAALEEKPSWIFVPIFFCLLTGSLLYSQAGRMRAMAPTSADAYAAWTRGQLPNAAYPRFSGKVYTVENALPIFRLGQNDTWAPDPHYKPLSWAPAHACLSWTAWFSSYALLSTLRIFLNLFGWFQAIVFGYALTSRFKA